SAAPAPARHPRAGAVAGVLLAVVLGLLAACGSAAPDPMSAVRGAVDKTYAAGTARASFSSATGPPGTPGTPVTGDGVVDLAGGRADTTVAVPLLGGGTRVLLAGGLLYAQVPPTLALLVPGGRPWASVPLDRLSTGAIAASLAQFGG